MINNNKVLKKLGLLFLYILLLFFIAEYFYPYKGELSLKSLKVGDIAQQDFYAPYSFPVKKSDKELTRERQIAMHSVYPYFSYNGNVRDSVFNLLDSLDISDKVRRNIKKTLHRVYNWLIVQNKNLLTADSAVVIINSNERLYPTTYFRDVSYALNYIDKKSYTFYPMDSVKRALFENITDQYVIPNCAYMKDFTEKKRKKAASGISETLTLVEKGEKIFSKGDTINSLIKRKLISMYDTRKVEFKGSLWQMPWTRRAIFLTLIIAFLSILYLFDPVKIFQIDRAVSVGVVYLLIIVAYNIVVRNNFNQFYTFIPFAGLLLSIVMGENDTFFFVFLISSILSIYAGSKVSVLLYNLLVGFSSILSSRTVKNRFAIYFAFLIIFVLELFLSFLFTRGFSQATVININSLAINSVVSSLVSVLLFMGTLPIYERISNNVTDFWLLELSNLNHPLLKELSERAPGTFTHSVSVGNLAAVASDSIKANSLLARVASYYHDIGKMKHPSFFIENQSGENPHDLLSPEMSASVIIGHVKDGVEMAQKYRLPMDIIRVIQTHHGKSVLKPFYQKALDLKKDVDIDSFRYPGPLPASKEESIVMLADSIDAAVRTLKSPSDKAVKELIARIISQKIEEGELDNSNLTLLEISRIGQAFFKMAKSIAHPRVEYPNANNNSKDSA